MQKANSKSIVAPSFHCFSFGMIHCLFRYSTDVEYILWRFNLLLLWLPGEISHSLLCSHSPWGSALVLAPSLCVGLLRASVTCLDRMGLKKRLIRALWLTQARGREGYRMWGEPVAAEANMTLQQPEVCLCSPGEVVPGSRDPGTGGLHRLPGEELWIVTCACAQASWWLQQQP